MTAPTDILLRSTKSPFRGRKFIRVLRLPCWYVLEVRGLLEKEETEACAGSVEEGRGEVRVTMRTVAGGMTSSQSGILQEGEGEMKLPPTIMANNSYYPWITNHTNQSVIITLTPGSLITQISQ